MFEIYALTTLGVMAAQASPGPNLVAVASVSLAQGRRAGLAVVAGVATGMLGWSLATAYGLSTLLAAFPWSMLIMRILGGCYLLWLAAKGVRAAISNEPGVIVASKRELNPRRAYRQGLLVVLTNPKAMMMWAAVATFLLGAGLSPEQALMFGPVAAMTALLIYGGYALLFSTNAAARIYGRFSRWIELNFSAIFGFLGGKLILDGVKELRS